MKNKLIKTFASLIISVILVYFLFKLVDPKDIYNTIINSNYYFILLALITYILVYIFRSLRFQILLKGDLMIKDLFPIVSIHNFFSMLLPFKTGELSYSFLLKKKSNISFKKSISNLLMARITDLFGIAVLFFISLSIFYILYRNNLNLSLLFLLLAIISFACMLSIFFLVKKFEFISKIKFNNKFLIKIQIFLQSLILESVLYS